MIFVILLFDYPHKDESKISAISCPILCKIYVITADWIATLQFSWKISSFAVKVAKWYSNYWMKMGCVNIMI